MKNSQPLKTELYNSNTKTLIGTNQTNKIGAKSTMKKFSNRVEIGKHAVWSLSSAKPGNGIQQLLDNRNDTFWQ